MLRFVGVIIDIKGDQDFLYTRESNSKLLMLSLSMTRGAGQGGVVASSPDRVTGLCHVSHHPS